MTVKNEPTPTTVWTRPETAIEGILTHTVVEDYAPATVAVEGRPHQSITIVK